MAEKGPGSTGKKASKRLARAKIKPTDNGIKSSRGRAGQVAAKVEDKESGKQKLIRIGIGIFAVVMALSMMLPSLTYIFGNPDDAQQQESTTTVEAEADADAEATDDEAADDEAADESAEADDASAEDEAADTTATGMATVDANYKAVVDPLESKLAENDKDLATLLNLGNDYMAWASAASAYALDDASAKHVTELYDKAIGCFDSYLELNDSDAVKVDRALCCYYSGNADAGLADLEKLTQDSPDYGPAWANLGMLYESKGDTEKAKEAYQKAVEADPDDEYGAKSFANRRIASMAASENGGDLTDGASDVTTGEGSNALSDALDSGL